MLSGRLFNRIHSALLAARPLGSLFVQQQQCSVPDSEMGSGGSPNISVTFLSSGSILAPLKSLVIVTAHTCYLINAPESMSRVLQESAARHSKISHIFVTGNQWELFGGLIGTCLNICGSGLQSAVNLHGPPVITDVANLMKKFSDTLSMKIVYNAAAEIQDSVFQISSLAIRSDSDNAQSHCYLFKPFPLPAKLDMLRAVKMNFPVSMLKDGVTAKRLKAGESVELPDGRVIDGKDLLIHPVQAKSLLVLDCATADLAVKLAACPELRRWIDPQQTGGIDLVVHLADASLLNSSQYRSVIDLFKDSDAKHAVMDGKCGRPALYGAHQCQLMLNSLDPGAFPLLYGHRFMACGDGANQPSKKAGDFEEQQQLHQDAAGQLNFPGGGATSCETYLDYQLRPPGGFQSGSVPEFTEAALRDKVFESGEAYLTRAEFAQRMAEFREAELQRQRLSGDEAAAAAAGASVEFPRIQFLGTVSSNPIKYRNVSAVLLHVSEDTKLLLDCGEGTLFQLMNFYGETGCQAVLRSIKAVCISHMHLDHQSGIFCLLKARRRAFEAAGLPPRPCGFVGPRGFGRWLEFFAENGSCGLGDVLTAGEMPVFWSEVVSGGANHWKEAPEILSSYQKFVKNELGLQHLAVIPVEHSTRVAYGFAVLGSSGSAGKPWKIVYSGDTVPCRSLVDAGMNCDLLIHEATFQDGRESEAFAKRHSTVGQALSQAAAMRARHTVLTHFSARYSCAVPALIPFEVDSAEPQSTGWGPPGVTFAYDHLCASLGDLARLPRLTRMLPCLFPKHFVELEKRSDRLRPPPGARGGRDDGDGGSTTSQAVKRLPRSGGAGAGGEKRRKFDTEAAATSGRRGATE